MNIEPFLSNAIVSVRRVWQVATLLVVIGSACLIACYVQVKSKGLPLGRTFPCVYWEREKDNVEQTVAERRTNISKCEVKRLVFQPVWDHSLAYHANIKSKDSVSCFRIF